MDKQFSNNNNNNNNKTGTKINEYRKNSLKNNNKQASINDSLLTTTNFPNSETNTGTMSPKPATTASSSNTNGNANPRSSSSCSSSSSYQTPPPQQQQQQQQQHPALAVYNATMQQFAAAAANYQQHPHMQAYPMANSQIIGYQAAPAPPNGSQSSAQSLLIAPMVHPNSLPIALPPHLSQQAMPAQNLSIVTLGAPAIPPGSGASSPSVQSSFPVAKNQQNKPNNWRAEPAESSSKQANNAVGSVTTSDDEESEGQPKTSQKAATTNANNRTGNNKNTSNSNNRPTNRQHNSPSISSSQGLASTQPQPIPTSYYYNQNANPSSFVASQQLLNEQPKLFSPSGSSGNISKRTDGLLSTSASSISNLEPSSDSNSQINIDTNQQEALAGGIDANLGGKIFVFNSSRDLTLDTGCF